ncbi:MAG: SOS response-associated peptidase [Acidobacteriota bacterium]
MCGRYSLRITVDELGDILGGTELDPAVAPALDETPGHQVAPSLDLPVLLDDGRRRVALHRWGLIPFWAKDEKIAYKLINARAETLPEKPAFREALGRRRCLVPASGFFEWKKLGAREKQPYLIRHRDGEPLTFAGLWERWRHGPDGVVHSFTIVTVAPNTLMTELHDRMPAILEGPAREAWLDPELSKDEHLGLLQPLRDGVLEAVPVSSLVGNPRNDLPECTQPVGAPLR